MKTAERFKLLRLVLFGKVSPIEADRQMAIPKQLALDNTEKGGKHGKGCAGIFYGADKDLRGD